MQGVNVVARPLDANGNPLYQYTVSFVSGAYFNGNHGNPVTGWDDANGNPLTMWGSNDPTLQGSFDLSGIPLPPGVNTANYQVTFEPINPLYILTDSVGPYAQGQVNPSGTLNAISVPNMSAGSAQTLNVTVSDSAVGGYNDAIGAQAQPRPMPTGGLWCGRLSQVGQSDWFTFPVRGNRIFTVVTQALTKPARPRTPRPCPPSASGTHSIPWAQRPWALRPASTASPPAKLGCAWPPMATTLCASASPTCAATDAPTTPTTDGSSTPILSRPRACPPPAVPSPFRAWAFALPTRFWSADRAALVTSISPNQITAIAPPAASGVTGSVDVEVDDLPTFYAAAVIPSGVSYDSGTGDALTLVTAP